MNAAAISITGESASTPMRGKSRANEMSNTELVQAGYRYALSIVHHHEDAEDLVQQAWMKLQRAYGGVGGVPVLFRTIRNLFYDMKRRSKIVQFEPLDSAPEPVRREASGVSLDMEEVMSRLRTEEREALYLNVVEGFTAGEIAEKTGSPRGTILSYIRRARQKLTRALGSELRDGNGKFS